MPDIDQQITGETGATEAAFDNRDDCGRFVKGRSGNPSGRPRGSINRATRMAGLLLDGEAEALTRKAVELALAGDVAALRLCFDRIIGRRRGRLVEIAAPPMDTEAGFAAAAVAVAQAAVQGAITPEEGMALSQMLQSCSAHIVRWRMWDGPHWRSLEEARPEPEDSAVLADEPAGADAAP